MLAESCQVQASNILPNRFTTCYGKLIGMLSHCVTNIFWCRINTPHKKMYHWKVAQYRHFLNPASAASGLYVRNQLNINNPMKTKKLVLIAVMALSIAIPSYATDAPANIRNSVPTESASSPRAQEIENRLEEIKKMDVKSMSRTEKRTLRKEVKSLEKEAKQMNSGGVYLSVGALLLIIILLIILL